MTAPQKRLDILLRHINNVRDNCVILAQKLEENGEDDFAIKLIANAQIHDNSKFHGIEWLYLHADVKDSKPELFKAANHQHIHNNQHHPEYWGDIHSMPRIYVAEMCADWLSRSQEFGQSLWTWINEEATAKYSFEKRQKQYKEIKYFVDILLDGAFK